MNITRKDIINKLRSAKKGSEREQILSIGKNRELLNSSGANVTLYSGEVTPQKSPLKELDNIYIGVIQRLNARTSAPDGIGALGGLSERTNEEYFANLSAEEKLALFGQKDDVILKDNKPVLTDDINIIRRNNVLRETREELGNLGIYDFEINPDNITLIDMPNVKDDNYAINIWNGEGDVWCITPYCHVMKTSEQTLDTLSKRSEDIHLHEQHSEAARFKKIKLTQALRSFGNMSGSHKLEDGRNANSDYRYPHEWLTTWALAAKLLNHDEGKIVQLYKEIQAQTGWKISFKRAAEKMGKDLSFIANTLKISVKAVETMEQMPSGGMFMSANTRHI